MHDEHYRQNITRTFLGFFGFEALGGFAIMLTHWVTLLPAYLKAAGAPYTAVALIAQAPQFLALFSMVITMRYLAWRPRRKGAASLLIGLGSLLLLPLAYLAMTFPTGSALLIWGSLGILFLRFGIVSCAGPLHYGMMMEVTPLEYRGRLMGFRLVAIGLMAVAGSYVAKSLLSKGGLDGYAWCFIVATGSMLGSLLFYLLIRERPKEHGNDSKAEKPRVMAQLKHLLAIPLFKLWIAAHLCWVGSLSGAGLVTVHYQKVLGGSSEVVGSLSIAFAVAILVAGPLFGLITDRLGSHFTSRIFFLAYALAFGLTALVGTAPLAYPVLVLLGIGHAVSEMWFANYQAELFPEENRVGMLAGIRIIAAPIAFITAYGYGQLREWGVAAETVFLLPFILALGGVMMIFFFLPNPRKTPNVPDFQPPIEPED